jgi:hypothetical protein
MSDENITAYPLARYEAYSVKGHGILLKMMLIATHPVSGEIERSFPIQMSVSQARTLAGDLLDAVTAAEMGQAPTATRN